MATTNHADKDDEVRAIAVRHSHDDHWNLLDDDENVAQGWNIYVGGREVGEGHFDADNAARVKVAHWMRHIGNTFAKCNSLIEIDLDCITSIQNRAFFGCYNLEIVHFSHDLKSIGESAFFHCHFLREVNLQWTKLETIEKKPFLGAITFFPLTFHLL